MYSQVVECRWHLPPFSSISVLKEENKQQKYKLHLSLNEGTSETQDHDNEEGLRSEGRATVWGEDAEGATATEISTLGGEYFCKVGPKPTGNYENMGSGLRLIAFLDPFHLREAVREDRIIDEQEAVCG